MDAETPNIARIYDYFLGGTSNFAVDRAVADKAAKLQPIAVQTVRENRAFLGRAVAHLAGEAGVGQFLDVGAGLPTMDNVHQIAQRVRPDARVVYVDNDPDVVAQATELLAGSVGVGAIEADVRDPAGILEHPVTRELLDLTEPVVLLFVSVLHFLTDAERPHEIVRRYLDALAPGSYLVVSHAGAPAGAERSAASREAVRSYNSGTANALNLREPAEIAAFFDGLEVLEPGVVNIATWRAAPAEVHDDAHGGFYGGVGRLSRPS